MIRTLAVLFALVTAAPLAPAQFTWNYPAGGNWSVGSNWVGGTAPTSTTTTALTFGSPATQSAAYTVTNDVANPFQLNALTFNNTTGTVTRAGSGRASPAPTPRSPSPAPPPPSASPPPTR